MSKAIAKLALETTQKIRSEVDEYSKPPAEGMIPQSQQIIPFSLVINTRGYIERVVHQINGSYENGCYDACAVMIRRLLETLVIETFEKHGIDKKIKDSDGHFFYLKDLIEHTKQESSWNLGRNIGKKLDHLKEIGDASAHSRRFNAQRQYIDEITHDLRVIVQEFISLANLKRK